MSDLHDYIATIETALRDYKHMLRDGANRAAATERLSEIIADAGGRLWFYRGYRIDFDDIVATSVIGPDNACRHWLKKAREIERGAA